jgi:DNA primase large subunit
MSLEDLRRSPTMRHLLEALKEGKDIGHYGRLTFAMAAHDFLDKEELAKILLKGKGADEQQVHALVQQVEARDYNPPSRQRILEWQAKQDFKICPNEDDPSACNLYQELDLPDEVFENIEEYRDQQFEATTG